MRLLCGSILKDGIILTFGERKKDRKKTCTWGVIPHAYAAVKSGAKSKQLAFCSARQSFSSHSCDVVHARTETADGDSDNDEHK